MPSDPRVEWIDLVIARALELRSVGALSIQADGYGVTLAALPIVATGEIEKSDIADEIVGDPLNDPASYPGGVVPGYRITKYETEE